MARKNLDNNQSLPILDKRPVVLQYSEIDGLIQRHNSSCQGDLSTEMSLLYDMVMKGEWDFVVQMLMPLQKCDGHTHSIYLIRRQEYIELLMSTLPEKEQIDKLLQKLLPLSVNSQEYNNLRLLREYPFPLSSSHSDYSDWSIDSSRGQLYRDLFLFLSRHMTLPHVTPLVQLVAKGLFYQLCEKYIIERCGQTTPPKNNDYLGLDVLSWLQQLPDSMYKYKFNILPISLMVDPPKTTPTSKKTTPTKVMSSLIVKSKTTPTLTKPIPVQVPAQLSCPAVMKKTTPTTEIVTPTTITTPKTTLTAPTTEITTPTSTVTTPTTTLPPVVMTVEAPPMTTPTTVNTPTIAVNGISTTTSQATPPKATPPLLNTTPPPTHSPLSASTPCDPTSRPLLSNQITLPTPILIKEEWPEVTLATTFTEKQVVRSVCFSTDGMATVGANTRTLTIFKPVTTPVVLNTLYTHPNYHRGSIYCMDWYSNSLLASGSNDQCINLLSHCNDSFTLIESIKEFGGTVRELTFLPNVTARHLLACGSGQYPLQLIDIEKLQVNRDFKPIDCSLLSIASIDDHTFVTGCENGSLLLWDLRCSLFPSTLFTSSQQQSITSLSLDHQGSIIACSNTHGDCFTLSLHTQGILNKWRPHNQECRSVRYSPDGHWLLTSSFDGSICLTNTMSYEYKVIGQRTNKVIQSRWHPSGKLILSACADKTATFWSLNYNNNNQ